MATILKCKICGGDISVNADMTVGTCQYCGTMMTLPRIDTDKKARMFNRAIQYRLNCEFDKAYDAYKTITEEDEQEAEAYWGMLLSEHGVEYVEDPKDKKRIPTCHRTILQPIKSSTNYKLACKYADAESKFIYQDEAEVLDRLQKNIVKISDRVEPYDVFICYKEKEGETEQRTKDSVLAQQIYDELSQEGIRTFFARISLEDKIGQEYEPYIFAALQSAKVMLVVSTSFENLEAVWVKNEWSRYLKFMQEDSGKTIIPVLSDMSPRELPDELSIFQAQDMGKVGAIQDLIRGLRKLLQPRGNDRDSILNQIIDEKKKEEQKRAERKRKAQKFIKIGTIILCAILSLSLIYAVIMHFRNESVRKEDLLNREYQITEGIPDSEKYDYFIVDITDDNFEEYFEARKYKSGTSFSWSLYSKAYDLGWCLYDWDSFSVSYKYSLPNKSYKSSESGDPINLKIVKDNSPHFNRTYHFSDCSGRLYFVSKRLLEECSYVNGVRTIHLKDEKIKEPLPNNPDAYHGSGEDYRW